MNKKDLRAFGINMDAGKKRKRYFILICTLRFVRQQNEVPQGFCFTKISTDKETHVCIDVVEDVAWLRARKKTGQVRAQCNSLNNPFGPIGTSIWNSVYGSASSSTYLEYLCTRSHLLVNLLQDADTKRDGV